MEKIDFVITYSDGNDLSWIKKRKKYGDYEEVIRYRSLDITKYWFRAVEKYAPWVNKIYFITDHQIPSWLNIDNKKLVIVNHEDYLDKEDLPTFNSNAIELKMHKIKGLSNNFVYFNDDFFLTDYVKEEDFFYNGLPKDNFAEKLFVSDDSSSFNHFILNNLAIINKYFDKKEVIKKNKKKFYNKLYIKDSIQSQYFRPFKKFINFNNPHICLSLTKNTFNLLWQKEEEILSKTCSSKFRNNDNVNIFLMRYYQLVSGNFIPRSSKFGHYFDLKNIEDIKKAIINKTYKCICINDKMDVDFEKIKIELEQTFSSVLSEKSSFER